MTQAWYEYLDAQRAIIEKEAARLRELLRPCSGEDCELRGIHKTADSRWLCSECAEDSDAMFDAACDGCGEHFDASFEMYDGKEPPFCSSRCANREERFEREAAYRYGR